MGTRFLASEEAQAPRRRDRGRQNAFGRDRRGRRALCSLFAEAGFTGDLDDVALDAGESGRLVHDVKPAAQIVREVMREAEEVIAQVRGP